MLNIANLITFSRIALAPIIVVLMLQNLWQAASVLFLLACATDLLDGFVARKFNFQSKIGQILDPIADKILLGSVMSTLLFLLEKSIIIKTVVSFLLIKEMILLSGGAILWFRYKKFIPPSALSRAVSLCEIVLVAAIFFSKLHLCNISEQIIFTILMINVVLSCWLLLRYLKTIKNF